MYKIYFKTNRILNNKRCINVTYYNANSIHSATLYALKNFPTLVEVVEV